MAVQSNPFPCPGPTRLYVRHRALRMPCLAALAAAALVVVLALARAPAVYAGPSHTVALTAIHAAAAQYVVGYLPTPDIGATLSVSPRYVAPWVWDGEDPDDPTFEPATVEVTATAADQDTAVMWYPWYPYILPILVLDPISVHNLAGPAGFSITQPWLGTTVKGEFSTVHCGEQQAARVTKAITWEADDQAMYGEGSDDETVEMTENVHVVLPNAATTEWLSCLVLQGQGVHMGDAMLHHVFYQPPDVGPPPDQAPEVSFAGYTIEEDDWVVLDVDSTHGLEEADVQDWLRGNLGGLTSQTIVESGNSYGDMHALNRWTSAQLYGSSLVCPGVITLRQGVRVVHPNEGPRWYHVIEHHLVGECSGPNSPGECYIRKDGYSKTSQTKTWDECASFPG